MLNYARRPSNGFTVWWRSLRAYSFPATVIPVVCATLLVRWRTSVGVQWLDGGLMLAAALLLHAAVNVLNDYHDFKRGLDSEESDNSSGVLTGGLMSPARLKQWGVLYLAAAVVLGVLLAWRVNWLLLPLGLVGLAGSYFYSHRFGYKYAGLGEPLVFLLMGPILFCAAALTAGGQLDALYLLSSLPYACLVTAILMINNLRDIAGDGSAGIRTIPMRLGERYSKIALSALVLAAPLLTLALGASGHWPRMALLAACIAFAPASCVVRRIMKARGLQSELADGPQSVAKLYATYGALVAAVFLAA